MHSTADPNATIASRINQWLETAAPADIHRTHVENLNVLPLTSDAGGFYALTTTGQVVELLWDETVAKEVTDARALNVALFQGAKRYPELTSLLPERPVAAVTCTNCDGTGEPNTLPGHLRDAVICYCGGAGWLPPGVPQLRSIKLHDQKALTSTNPFFSPIVLLALAAVLLLTGLYVSLSAIAGASLACIRCNCRYSVFASDPSCRWPAIWTYTSYACFILFVMLTGLAWREHRRRLTLV